MVAAISKAKKSSSPIHLPFEGKGQSTKVKTKNRCANKTCKTKPPVK
jgi:hypothetical protein